MTCATSRRLDEEAQRMADDAAAAAIIAQWVKMQRKERSAFIRRLHFKEQNVIYKFIGGMARQWPTHKHSFTIQHHNKNK